MRRCLSRNIVVAAPENQCSQQTTPDMRQSWNTPKDCLCWGEVAAKSQVNRSPNLLFNRRPRLSLKEWCNSDRIESCSHRRAIYYCLNTTGQAASGLPPRRSGTPLPSHKGTMYRGVASLAAAAVSSFVLRSPWFLWCGTCRLCEGNKAMMKQTAICLLTALKV